jgi:cell division protein FtsI (penicillin-binding protein 3)
MAPKTGELLAVAHYPYFNPNTFRDFDRGAWRNRAVTDPFEPGSTVKIFSAVAAIESGGSTPNTIFFCENGAYKIGKNVVHDHTPHGWLSLQQIVKYSSNIGAIKISEMIGREPLYNTLRTFGFGQKTGIDCPGETVGSLSHYKRWSKIDTGAISFGQGVSVSAVQLITATSAIANGGMLMKPRIVQAILDANGKVLENRRPKMVRRVASRNTARIVARIMKTVITPGGTGVNAALDGYTVSGKTGTAQKSGKHGTYAKGKYVSSFVGFTPSENPAVTILVVVDEPRNDYHGSKVAAPVFKKIALETLNYLNIPPSGGADRLTAALGNEADG